MKATEFLKNIKILKEKKKLYDDIGKTDKTLDIILSVYQAAKNSFTDRQLNILELHYIKEYTKTDTALTMNWSRRTIDRDINKMKNKIKQITKNIDKDLNINKYI